LGLDVPKEKRNLNTTSYDYSVEFLFSLMKEPNAKIILEVPFQRQFIWKVDRTSQLIESIIMNVPIPPLYFAEEENNKWLVVDGLQRLYSISTFFQNEFALCKLEIIKELENLKYKDLPPKSKSLLNDGMMRVNVIKRDSHPDIKYDIFMRLNRGSVILNNQELRNCLYRGSLNALAKKLVSDNKDFLLILKLKKPHERFLDVEFIIRFLAFIKNIRKDEEGKYYLEDYKGRLLTYINDFMQKNQNIDQGEGEKLAETFNGVIKKVVNVFGVKNAFRDLTGKSTKVNKAISDFIVLSFSMINEDILIEKREGIINLLKRLLEEDAKFKKSISQRTSDVENVNYRINTWFKELKNVVPF